MEQKKQTKSGLLVTGLLITVAYIVAVVCFRFESLGCLKTMPLNEFGDFLAGVFNPIAFMWLVLGYLMQGRELKQNTTALEYQATELKNAVVQYKEMAEVAKSQHKHELRLHHEQLKEKYDKKQALIDVMLDSQTTELFEDGRQVIHFTILNKGRELTGVTLYHNDIALIEPKPIWSSGELFKVLAIIST